MEGSDAFGSEIGNAEDPFAGGEDWAGFGGEPKDGQPATDELKQVDREGNAVEASAPDTRSKLERMEDSYQYASSHGEPVSEELRDAHLEFERQKGQAADDDEFEAAAPEAQSDAERAAEVSPDPNDALRAQAQRERETSEQAQAEQAAEHNEEQAATDAQEAADAAERAVEDVQAAEAERETAEAPQEAAAEAEAPAPKPEAAPEPEAAAEEPAAASEPEAEAPVPEERQSPGGKTTHRRYYVLHVTGPGKFDQVTWYENKDGKMVPKGTAGAKRQGVALCRGTEEALKKGHAALGSPTETVNLVAVAALHFQPRPVAPEPVEPTRVRLKIG